MQGVFFRDSTREHAHRAGVDGWVRNLRDGRVEAVIEGVPDAVQAVVDFCSEGPQWARVDGIEVIEERPEGLEGFSIR